jgi:hypothetical protein
VANPYPNREIDSNESVLVAVFRVLRRQPWKTMATRTWDAVSRLFLSALLATVLTGLLVTAAHARTYEVLTTNVPFKFKVGDRTFQPGLYQFILVGPGRLAIRDAHQHFIASLITRSRELGGAAPATKLVFDTPKKHPAQLDQIWIENRSQVLDVVGEELAVRQPSPVPAPMLPPGVSSLFARRAEPGLKH